jgi:DNA-binding CsgD family transcriptional regulator
VGASGGWVAAPLVGVHRGAVGWVVARVRDAAREALESGAPRAAAELLTRALAEPPSPSDRAAVLREAARAEWHAGGGRACAHLETALALARDARERGDVALELGLVHNGGFRWVEAVDVLERALADLDGEHAALATRLECELIAAALHDARTAQRALPVLERLTARGVEGAAVEAVATAQGMIALYAACPVGSAAPPLEAVLARASPRPENWERRAALLYTLIAMERFDAVDAALGPMLAEAGRSGSSAGLFASHCALALLRLRLGALPEADAAARVALEVGHHGDFTPGLPFAVTLLAEVAIEVGDLDEAQAHIDLLPQGGWPAGVGTVLIPAARGRLRLAQGRPAEALADFRTCLVLWSPEVWGLEMRDSGYLDAHAGAAQALLLLGDREGAEHHAQAGVAAMRRFDAPRALGIALRVSGLAHGGDRGLASLRESVAVLRDSPAVLELARSLAELGAALRRADARRAAREPLTEALDLAARCAARPLAARVREELRILGARPRRDWRVGVESLTPSELRVARLAADGLTNREIAQSLYLSLKTVEAHLAHAYDKLGIAGRGELPGILAPTPS